jgi:hypothetical protein
MKMPSRIPRETADEPTESCRSWNQTTSYMSAAQPDPIKRTSRAGNQLEPCLAEAEAEAEGESGTAICRAVAEAGGGTSVSN